MTVDVFVVQLDSDVLSICRVYAILLVSSCVPLGSRHLGVGLLDSPSSSGKLRCC